MYIIHNLNICVYEELFLPNMALRDKTQSCSTNKNIKTEIKTLNLFYGKTCFHYHKVCSNQVLRNSVHALFSIDFPFTTMKYLQSSSRSANEHIRKYIPYNTPKPQFHTYASNCFSSSSLGMSPNFTKPQ